MSHSKLQELVQLLKREFSLPSEQIRVAIKQSQRQQGPLPIVLWQYGFITLEQLDQLQQLLVSRETFLACY
jgi:hypothetical protein